jgi:hypothetical protein
MSDISCRNCSWWGGTQRELRDGLRAPCLYPAPRVELVPDRNRPGELRALTVRPMVLADERCRHWRGRASAEEPQPGAFSPDWWRARIGCTATDSEGERWRITAVTDHAGDRPHLHLTRMRDQQPETWTCDSPAARGLRMEEGPCA